MPLGLPFSECRHCPREPDLYDPVPGSDGCSRARYPAFEDQLQSAGPVVVKRSLGMRLKRLLSKPGTRTPRKPVERTLRVIHLINHCRFGHGNVHAAVDLACAQAASGDEVAVASGPGELKPLLGQTRVGYFALNQESRKPAAVLGMIRGLRKVMADFRPDIIHGRPVASRRSPA